MSHRTEMLEKCRAWLDAHENEMIEDLKSFVSCRSVSRADLAAPGAPFGPENAEMLNRILWRAARFGFETKNGNGYYGTVNKIRTYNDGDAILVNPGETLLVDFGQNFAGWEALEFEAADQDVQAALFGHTHLGHLEYANGCLFLNPGAVCNYGPHLPVCAELLVSDDGSVRASLQQQG